MSKNEWYNELKSQLQKAVEDVELTNHSILEWCEMIQGLALEAELYSASEAVDYIVMENNENTERWCKISSDLIKALERCLRSE